MRGSVGRHPPPDAHHTQQTVHRTPHTCLPAERSSALGAEVALKLDVATGYDQLSGRTGTLMYMVRGWRWAMWCVCVCGGGRTRVKAGDG